MNQKKSGSPLGRILFFLIIAFIVFKFINRNKQPRPDPEQPPNQIVKPGTPQQTEPVTVNLNPDNTPGATAKSDPGSTGKGGWKLEEVDSSGGKATPNAAATGSPKQRTGKGGWKIEEVDGSKATPKTSPGITVTQGRPATGIPSRPKGTVGKDGWKIEEVGKPGAKPALPGPVPKKTTQGNWSVEEVKPGRKPAPSQKPLVDSIVPKFSIPAEPTPKP